MPFKRAQVIDEISCKLAQLRLEMMDHNKLGLYDNNAIAENFFCGFLNILKGWNLKNANDAKKNFPGIDLIDEEKRIVIQISSTATAEKIQHSLDELSAHTVVSEEYQFYMLILSEKQKRYLKEFETHGMVKFDKETDIWDVSDLLGQIKRSETTIQTVEKLYQYLQDELGFIDKDSSKWNSSRNINHFLSEKSVSEENGTQIRFGLAKEYNQKCDITEKNLILHKGDTYEFGWYPQHKDGSLKRILWKVLDVDQKNKRALLLSDKILDTVPYEVEWKNTSWAECTLRRWLNSPEYVSPKGKKCFLLEAFSENDAKRILDAAVTPDKNPHSDYRDVYQGDMVLDKIFLLSGLEVVKYFAEEGAYEDGPFRYTLNGNKAVAKATDYAHEKGLESSDKPDWWWSRSMGASASQVMCVSDEGNLSVGNIASHPRIGVRPALWISLNL